jgi:hypothetical protein
MIKKYIDLNYQSSYFKTFFIYYCLKFIALSLFPVNKSAVLRNIEAAAQTQLTKKKNKVCK